jgi:hypothetical protein
MDAIHAKVVRVVMASCQEVTTTREGIMALIKEAEARGTLAKREA